MNTISRLVLENAHIVCIEGLLYLLFSDLLLYSVLEDVSYSLRINFFIILFL